MIDGHSVNHHAYPVVHFYRQNKKKDSFSINITRLDAAVSILLNSIEAKNSHEELKLLRSSLSAFLDDIQENFSLKRLGDNSTSRPIFSLTIIDFGQNLENILKLENRIKSLG